jgi:ferredoxin
MAKYKVEVNREECTGCMACNATCPEVFEMKDDDKGAQKAKPVKEDVDELGCAMDAAQVCPVNCIHITETEENKKLI